MEREIVALRERLAQAEQVMPRLEEWESAAKRAYAQDSRVLLEPADVFSVVTDLRAAFRGGEQSEG